MCIRDRFTTKRPDVLFIIMESFSSWLMTTLGGEPGVAVQLDSLAPVSYTHLDVYKRQEKGYHGWKDFIAKNPDKVKR